MKPHNYYGLKSIHKKKFGAITHPWHKVTKPIILYKDSCMKIKWMDDRVNRYMNRQMDRWIDRLIGNRFMSSSF